MKRRLFTLAAAASLLLCAATAVLWIRSYRVSDALGLSEHVRLFTDRGTLVAFVAEPHSNFYWSLGYGSWELPDPDATFNPRRVSKRTWNVLVAHGESFPALRIVVVQLWAILVLAGFLPVLLFTRIVRQRRLIRRGRCAKCGYDLRATPQRCPNAGRRRRNHSRRQGAPRKDEDESASAFLARLGALGASILHCCKSPAPAAGHAGAAVVRIRARRRLVVGGGRGRR